MTINEFIEAHRIEIATLAAWGNPYMEPMPGSSHWSCLLTFGPKVSKIDTRRTMVVPYTMGAAHKGKPPTAADVLDSLASDASGADQDFEDWAGEYGYDVDSRKAKRTYKAVRRQTRALRQFLGAALFRVLLEEVERQ